MPAAKRLTFPSSHRLGGRREFADVFAAKMRVSRGTLSVFGKPNGKKHNRLGLSVSRKLGSAVVRNRIKRLLREAYRLTRRDLPCGYDLVIVPRPHALRGLIEYRELLAWLIGACDAAWKKRLNQ